MLRGPATVKGAPIHLLQGEPVTPEHASPQDELFVFKMATGDEINPAPARLHLEEANAIAVVFERVKDERVRRATKISPKAHLGVQTHEDEEVEIGTDVKKDDGWRRPS